MNYKKVINRLNHSLSNLSYNNQWWYFELCEYYNIEGDVKVIYLVDSNNDNKYRIHHNELDDWITSEDELEKDILVQLNRYFDNLVEVVNNVDRIVNQINEMNRIGEREGD